MRFKDCLVLVSPEGLWVPDKGLGALAAGDIARFLAIHEAVNDVVAWRIWNTRCWWPACNRGKIEPIQL